MDTCLEGVPAGAAVDVLTHANGHVGSERAWDPLYARSNAQDARGSAEMQGAASVGELHPREKLNFPMNNILISTTNILNSTDNILISTDNIQNHTYYLVITTNSILVTTDDILVSTNNMGKFNFSRGCRIAPGLLLGCTSCCAWLVLAAPGCE